MPAGVVQPQVISRAVDDRAYTVQPEEADDLLAVRRVLEAGDLVSGVTSRVVKREREYARPDRGERVTMRLTVQVESAALDSVLDRLRVRGTITASTHESVQRGSHHSIIVQPGETVSIAKARWSAVHRRLVSGGGGAGGVGGAAGSRGFVLVAVDSAECGVARLKGTRLNAASPVRSGAGGKRYAGGGAIPARYFEDIAAAVGSLAQKGDAIVVFGPGEAKRRTANRLQVGGGTGVEGKGAVPPVTVVDGGDTGGMDGIYAFTRSAAMRQVIGGGKLAVVYGIVEEVMRMAGARSRRFAMGYAEADRASRLGAVESLVFSEKLLHDAGEQAAVDLLNRVDGGGGAVYGADSSTDAGMQVAGLGGVVCILRYAVE